MVSFKSLLSIAAFISLAVADTKCNPLTATNCAADPALGGDISDTFTSESSHYSTLTTPSGVSYTLDGLELTLSAKGDNPSIESNFYIMFGRVEVHLKAATGQGIVSSFFLQSDDLDEIDLEFFGTDTTQVQSNWFSKGSTVTYDRGVYTNMASPPQDSFHNYTVDWTDKYLNWWVDGVLTRTLLPDNPQGFPQTPMKLFAGIWAGGDSSNTVYTIEWAGGATDYTKAPFTMAINKLLVSDYSTGTSYSYGDQSGDWTSIKSDGGSVLGREQLYDVGSSNVSPSSSPETFGSATSAATSSTSSSASSSSASSSASSSSSSASASSSSASSKSSSTSSASSSSASSSASASATLSSASTTSSASKSSSSSSAISISSAPVESESTSSATKTSVASSSASTTAETVHPPAPSTSASATSAGIFITSGTVSQVRTGSVTSAATTLITSTGSASISGSTSAPVESASSSHSVITSINAAASSTYSFAWAALTLLAYFA